MIAVNKNFDNIPAILRSAECAASLQAVLDTTNSKHKDNIDDQYYGHNTVRTRLKAIYHNKCAYCETYEPEPEVEHYRPKKRVNGVPGYAGYYWLCYEWTNLLPACHDCNKNGAKGMHFPVHSDRVLGPPMNGSLLNVAECQLLSNTLTVTEVPLFLNPEVPGFDPFHYFKFEADGTIKEAPVRGTLDYSKAENTIRIARLDRDKLYLNVRKKQIRYYMGRITGYLALFLSGETNEHLFVGSINRVLNEIRGNSLPNKEYSFFWNYFYINFNRYIDSYFKPKYRPRFHQIVNEYKQNNP